MKQITDIPADYPMVTVQYQGGGAKAPVVGLVTRRNYGRKQGGDIFQMHMDDVEAMPEMFSVLASPASPSEALPKTPDTVKMPEQVLRPSSVPAIIETEPEQMEDEEPAHTLDEPVKADPLQSFVETPVQRKRRRRAKRN